MTAAVGLRERKKARTREALKDAAMDLFTRQGFDGTTVEEIADACEVSPRTFFRYFPTKEDVLFADTEARRERLLAVLADQPAGDSAFVALRAAMRALARRLPRRPRRARRPVEDRRRASPQLQAYKAEHQHGWEAAVVDVLERRPARAGAPVDRGGAPAAHRGRHRGDAGVARRVDRRRRRPRSRRARLDAAFARLASGFGSIRSG